MKKNIFLNILLLLLGVFNIFNVNASIEDYTILRDIDKRTFNEYRYLMVKEYFLLKEKFQLKNEIDKDVAQKILSHAKVGYNYLPNSLINTNYFNDLKIAIEKGISSPNSEVYYEDIVKKLDEYIEKVNLQKITGSIEVSPSSGNAPLTTTFRGKVTDPSGTIIPSTNYVWWFDNGGIKKVVGRGQSINYTFKEEGNFSMFLDVKSNHKNAGGYNDVLPFSSRGLVEVKEKIASVIININSVGLKESDQIKFTPEESNYGLIFDATNSTPTGGAKFRKTQWNFGNGVERSYDGSPKIERVVYSKEGDYPVVLKLTTNEGKTIERKFTVAIHKPIATIQANKDDGYIGEKFTFSARSSINEKNLSYSWNIIDISDDKIITTKNGNILNYSFTQKGRYNVQLHVKDAAGNNDTDTKIIYINSRAPVAELTYTIPDKSKPNKVLLDGTKSYDPDYTDDGKLKYIWTINGEKVDIDAIDSKGAIGYYTFESIGDHSVVLEVIDPDDMSNIKQQKIKINSILSIEFIPIPRVSQRDKIVRFSVISTNAKYFEWDFGDGIQEQTSSNKMSHKYIKSGIFNVKLTVKDIEGNSNQLTKTVYVSESDTPYSAIGVDFGANESPNFDQNACNGGAYIVDRVKPVFFKGGDSINLDGTNNGLSYTWKIGNNKFITSRDTNYKFSELGCFPVKLTVKSDKSGVTHSSETWVKVENLKPTLSSISLSAQNLESDPVVVSVSAVGASDLDGVVQSYLWYYYTDSDPEPQDFRMTALSNTTFVIPKITGNYYFVVVMRDNNDSRYSSEELDSNKYFISLSGDNINTPLADLKVNKNNILIGEEVSFTTKVKNVLGQDITKSSEYAWDFDGDGFYDEESSSPDITHKFEKSGTFYSKVRIKNKGMTNVRTVEINVANILSADFKYNSIGNTYIFFNTSLGKYDKIVWDMGDGSKIEDKNTFVYTYEDGKSSHDVQLKISEGTKIKTKTIEIEKDLKEMMNARKSKDIYLLSNQKIEDDKIIVQEDNQKIYIYIHKKDDSLNYGVDFDINIDSDLNGTKDDDIDNSKDSSFENAGVIEIILNNSKNQNFRIFTQSKSGEMIDSKDIKIEKKYIKDEEINIDSIKFDGVSDGEKVKIEKLKTFIQQLPQEHRLKGMQYIQKLQEEWFYEAEKTKVILEFESFIDGLGVTNATEIINLLESLLVEGQDDQSLRNMSYNVVKNLIPKELVEYNEIIANLDQIKLNPSKLEENKVLGKEVLSMIKDTSLISNEDKMTIKTQLQVFIYGTIDQIPEEIKQEVQKDNGTGNKVVGLLSGVANTIGIIFGIIILIIIGFFVWFKLSNKNKNLGLQDFIIEKTSNQTTDILSSLENENQVTRTTQIPKKDNSNIDILNQSSKQQETKVEEEQVPDWLKGSLQQEKPKEDEVVNLSNDELETKVEEEQVPDWLKGSLQQEKPKEDEVVNLSNDELETKVEEEQVPDWLKGSLQQEKPKEDEVVNLSNDELETKVEEEQTIDLLNLDLPEAKQELREEDIVNLSNDKIETKVEEEQVPDWLKGVISTDKLTPTIKDDLITKKSLKEDILISTDEDKIEKKLKVARKKISKTNLEDNKSSEEKTPKKVDNLWEDGMDIPDWLKEVSPPPKKQDINSNNGKDDFWTLDGAGDDK